MERKGQISEIIIKLLFAIASIIAIVFIILNSLKMIPLYSRFESKSAILTGLSDTHFGDLMYNLITFDGKLSFLFILKTIAMFIYNMEWICYVFVVFELALLVINFVFIKWKVITRYFILVVVLSFFYILKYLLFTLAFYYMMSLDFTYSNTWLNIGTTIYLVISLFEVFICSLFIVKFILNLPGDMKYLLSN